MIAYRFTFGRPDLDSLRRLCWARFAWPQDKADELLLPMIKAFDDRQAQTTLDSFLSYRQRFAKIKSKRMQKAVKAIAQGAGGSQEEILLQDGEMPGTTRKIKTKAKAAEPGGAATKRKRIAKKKAISAENSEDEDEIVVIDTDDDVQIVQRNSSGAANNDTLQAPAPKRRRSKKAAAAKGNK